MVMKKVAILLGFFSMIVSYAQNSGQHTLVWTTKQNYKQGLNSIALPHFSNDG